MRLTSFTLFQGIAMLAIGARAQTSWYGGGDGTIVECGTKDPERTQCDKRPTEIRMRYTGGSCADSDNEQNDWLFHCLELRDPTTSDVLAIAHDIRGGSYEFFNGELELDDNFMLEREDGGRLDANMNITVYSPPVKAPENIVQTMVFHTSCSSNLNFGDTFGNFEVIGWKNSDEHVILCTSAPSQNPSSSPSASPTSSPSASPSSAPSKAPTVLRSGVPSTTPSASPTSSPSESPSDSPTSSPSSAPSKSPTAIPSRSPTSSPSESPSDSPSSSPSSAPSKSPTTLSSGVPSATPSLSPSDVPSTSPSASPSLPCITATPKTFEGRTVIDVVFNYPHLDPQLGDWIGIYHCSDADSTEPWSVHPQVWAWNCYNERCPTNVSRGEITLDDQNRPFPHAYLSLISDLEGCFVVLLNRKDGASPPPYYNVCVGNEFTL